jgi:hypothetical protein
MWQNHSPYDLDGKEKDRKEARIPISPSRDAHNDLNDLTLGYTPESFHYL